MEGVGYFTGVVSDFIRGIRESEKTVPWDKVAPAQ